MDRESAIIEKNHTQIISGKTKGFFSETWIEKMVLKYKKYD